jgi:hypothetical protein
VKTIQFLLQLSALFQWPLILLWLIPYWIAKGVIYLIDRRRSWQS